jgi:D-glycero-D-manno-heptose 1,7-bisphosphate phosphatase
MPSRPAAFLDRDGVINVDHGYIHRIEQFDFIDGVREAARELSRMGLAIVVVTNQAGIGRGMYTQADFNRLTEWMRGQFAAAGAPIDGVYHCPHHPSLALGEYRVACNCRKPAPGMLLDSARDLDLDLSRSVFFGDKCDDMRAGNAASVGLCVHLGKDGRQLPTDTCEGTRIDQRFASLGDAVADAGFARRLRALAARDGSSVHA